MHPNPANHPLAASDAALARYAPDADPAAVPAVALADLDARVEELLARSQAHNTMRAYRSDLRTFADWAAGLGITEVPVPPRNVARFLAWSADQGLKISTIERRLAALSWLHRKLDAPPPSAHGLVKETMKGIRRELREDGRTRPDPKAALSPAEIVAMVDACRADFLDRPHGGDRLSAEQRRANRLDLLARRDTALLLLGYAGGMRRSELANLRSIDIDHRPDGLVVLLRWSKGDQEGHGRLVGIRPHPTDERYCPVRQTREWLARIKLVTGSEPSRLGPLFRRIHRSGTVIASPISGQTVALVIKSRARAAETPTTPDRLAGHSLRRGMITALSERDVAVDRIADHVGHQDVNTTRGYRDKAVVLDSSPSALVWA